MAGRGSGQSAGGIYQRRRQDRMESRMIRLEHAVGDVNKIRDIEKRIVKLEKQIERQIEHNLATRINKIERAVERLEKRK